jgi:undecaprenyl pyrophosphate synthase
VKRIGFQLTDAGLALAEWDSSRTPVPTKKPKSVKKVTFSSPPVESIENELPRLMKLVKPVLKSLVSIEEMEAVRDELQADIDASIAKLPPKVLDAWRKLQQIQSQMKALYKKKK